MTMNTHKTKQPGKGSIARTIIMSLMLAAAFQTFAKDVKDADITSAIHSELWVDNAVSANNIDVTTKNGIVTLAGVVESILAEERAIAITEAIVGVRAIVNTIDVQPEKPRDDKKLAQAIQDAWLADPVADSYELQAKSDNGVVTISGTVDSYAERTLSEKVVKSIQGVRDVKNFIKVDYKSVRTDTEIMREIKERLKNDVRIDDYLVEVKVQEGNVTLSGVVGSLQEKNQTANNALIAGVKSVNDDELKIKWWARDKMRRKKAYKSRTDREIEKAVKDAFFYDPRVYSFNPDVAVSKGTVTLSGRVDNLQAKRAAEADAKNTLGVWRVKNHLKVRPLIIDNHVLEQRVASALLADPYVALFDIDIDAHRGWITLSGDLNNSFEKNQAQRVAEGVKGVIGITNNLEFDHLWLWKPDWEIREDVKDQLIWSVFVDSEDIDVSVENGIVTLDGKVNSWTELQEAEKNAYQGGAKDVDNKLSVDYEFYGPSSPTYYGFEYPPTLIQ